jgi:DNA-binding MarR family transcriptional regulator
MAIALEVYEAMASAGCTAEQMLAAMRADRELRIARRLYRAVKLALQAPQSPILVPVFEAIKADSGAKADSGDTGSYISSPLKSAARAGALAHSGLRPAARRVLARLIEHLNLETGRCDPGITRLAADLGLDPRSVRRAVDQLVAAGLVVRHLHRGRGHTNAYALDLEALSAIAAAAAPGGAKEDSEQKRTLESAKPDRRVLQNRRNKQDLQVPRARPDPNQPQLYLPIVNSRPVVDKGNADFGHAASRVWRDARAHLKGESLAQAIVRIGELGLEDRAIAAEMRQTGSGIFVLLTALHQDAHGPPRAAGEG